MRKEKYFLMFLRTGGGHLAPARSVEEYLKKNYSEKIEPVLIDGLQSSPSYLKFIVEDGYRILQNRAKWYYESLYAVNKIIPFAKLSNLLVSNRIKPVIKKRIIEEKPDKIVIFHFFLIRPVFEILKELGLNIPVITVVTDPFIAHPIWFLNHKQTFIVFSERLKNYALKRKVPSENLHVFPFILNEKFSNPIPKDQITQLKKSLGFQEDKKIVLIVGGGDGIPKGERIVRNLIERLDSAQIAVVCGKNKKFFQSVQKMKENYELSTLKVFQYVDFIYELLNISDIVITKCGASTFMEILMIKKIPVVNNYIWEQEKGNVEFLVTNNLGIYERNIKKLPLLIRHLLCEPEVYNFYLSNIEKAHLRNGTPDVSEFIVNFSL